MKKSFVRPVMLKLRNNLSEEDILGRSNIIVEKLLESNLFLTSANILVYLPLKKEVDCTLLIKKLRNMGKSIFLPAYDKKAWIICEYLPADRLVVTVSGIRQPEVLRKVKTEDIDAVILPGLAFSRHGVRVGFGTGVYDRLLKDSQALKVGVCFDFQIVDDITSDVHDVKVDYIVSEDVLIKIT